MTSLFKKLNFKDHPHVVCIHAPDSFKSELKEMSKETKIFNSLDGLGEISFFIAFATKQKEVDDLAVAIAPKLIGDAVVWFCYPKGTSKKYKCEFNRDTGWTALGKQGMEGVRAVAIDEDWSALRFRKVEYIKTMTRSFAMTAEGKKKAEK